MLLSYYQELALETDVTFKTDKGVKLPLLGLFGEAGSLLSALKKHLREKEGFVTYKAVIKEELGDCLWYLANVCSRYDIDFDELGVEIVKNKMASLHEGDIRAPTMDELQALAKATTMISESTFETDLFQLGAVAGRLLYASQENNELNIRDSLRDMLWAISKAAVNSNISLLDAAESNLAKNKSRWPGEEKIYLKLFDEGCHEEECLPRKFDITFVEYARGDRTFVIQRCNGINIGDRLTDNKIDPDDYRFHDVFHLAYAAHLGWSPVLRALFKVKRKSNRAVDEAQDGARAIIIEEGISTWVFGRALELDSYEKLDYVEYSLLKALKDFVSGFEVDKCPLWQWEKAILDGFRVFRELKKYRCGIVVVDLVNHTLEFRKLDENS